MTSSKPNQRRPYWEWTCRIMIVARLAIEIVRLINEHR
jgi:hypothetical protein